MGLKNIWMLKGIKITVFTTTKKKTIFIFIAFDKLYGKTEWN